ncbi:MAG: hypothetical protein M1827_005234 [Pycnora praestabilis]|nr:MAG: hypothetical protein M1827_005234 [Pycnora praestabilis]
MVFTLGADENSSSTPKTVAGDVVFPPSSPSQPITFSQTTNIQQRHDWRTRWNRLIHHLRIIEAKNLSLENQISDLQISHAEALDEISRMHAWNHHLIRENEENLVDQIVKTEDDKVAAERQWAGEVETLMRELQEERGARFVEQGMKAYWKRMYMREESKRTSESSRNVKQTGKAREARGTEYLFVNVNQNPSESKEEDVEEEAHTVGKADWGSGGKRKKRGEGWEW